MKRKILHIYEFIVTILGIGIPLFLSLEARVFFPPLYEYAVYFIVALISGYLCITVKNTILSFDIVIYYFLLLTFGPLTASLTAMFVILLLWSYNAYSDSKSKDRDYVNKTLRMGLYNAGVYGLVYLVAGFIYLYFEKNIGMGIGMVVSILSLVFLNEVSFSIHTLLSGEKYFKYLKDEGIWSDLVEIAVYPLGISMFLLYRGGAFLEAVPFIIGILLLTYIGRMMSNYQERLAKSLSDIIKLNKISRNLSSILQLNTLMETVLKEIYNMLKPEGCSIYFKSPYDGKEYFYSYNGKKIEEKGPCEAKKDSGAKIVPLKTGKKKLGFLEIDIGRSLTANETAIAENIAEQASVSLSNAMMYNISIKDPLTDLYTRRHFETRLKEEISRADRENQSFSLVMFDIDKLKEINDNFGHKVGDEVLKSFSETVKGYTRPFDVSARWGGDEIILILPKTHKKHALEIGKRIIDKFSGILKAENGRDIKVSACYAGEEYKPKSGIGAGEIFYRVDKKLIERKKKTV
ncbi:GGDEF domain-containing protein [candidate division WOR-3 bacterium]|nr:GGDEF domain-containing protein [candidate division WOR-3 bacterium]